MVGLDFTVFISPDLSPSLSRKEISEKKVIHRAASRGHDNHGWLDTYHSFSFASFYNPERMRFGMLRVLNDDTVAPGMGFSMHPSENMEIITIPLEGSLEHMDSMGNISVVKKGEVQVVSAGVGLKHSEYNKNPDRLLRFLQIWIYPGSRNSMPHYDHCRYDVHKMHNGLVQLASAEDSEEGVRVNQRAWVNMGRLDKGHEIEYSLRDRRNGVYVFILKGEVEVNSNQLRTRDAIGLWDTKRVRIAAGTMAEILVIEVPME